MSYIYEKLNYTLFEQRFKALDRIDQFGGYQGLEAFFNALERLAEDTVGPIKLDVIGLCCEYTYYESLDDYNNYYNTEYGAITDINELFCKVDGESFITYAH